MSLSWFKQEIGGGPSIRPYAVVIADAARNLDAGGTAPLHFSRFLHDSLPEEFGESAKTDQQTEAVGVNAVLGAAEFSPYMENTEQGGKEKAHGCAQPGT